MVSPFHRCINMYLIPELTTCLRLLRILRLALMTARRCQSATAALQDLAIRRLRRNAVSVAANCLCALYAASCFFATDRDSSKKTTSCILYVQLVMACSTCRRRDCSCSTTCCPVSCSWTRLLTVDSCASEADIISLFGLATSCCRVSDSRKILVTVDWHVSEAEMTRTR